MTKTLTTIAILLTLAGCGDDTPPTSLPKCDTLTSVFFVSRCNDSAHARCALKTTAPLGASATGCELTIIAVPGEPEQVECVEFCDLINKVR